MRATDFNASWLNTNNKPNVKKFPINQITDLAQVAQKMETMLRNAAMIDASAAKDFLRGIDKTSTEYGLYKLIADLVWAVDEYPEE